MTSRPAALAVVPTLALAAWVAAPAHATDLQLTRLSTGGGSPIFLTTPPNSDQLYLARRSGAVERWTGAAWANVFTIPSVDAAGEGGLLGLAFHPNFDTNRKLYVYVTIDNGGLRVLGQVSPFSTRIREYTLNAAGTALASGPVEVLSFPQPYSNHNGGWIGFGQDNLLYIASGDGGSGGDPFNQGQQTNTLLGKMLRIDINRDDFPADAARNYAIPAPNPFAGSTTSLPEIYMWGLRNPYRNSFDRVAGDLWIADVGQGDFEEINRVRASTDRSVPGGQNFGWARREGFNPFNGGALLATDTQPVYEYVHGFGPLQGNSVLGGYVYRGPVTEHRGFYIFADTISNNVWRFDPANPAGTVERLNLITDAGTLSTPVSFGEDARGNLYVLDFSSDEVFRVTGAVSCTADLNFDRSLNVFDVLAFFDLFGTRNIQADIDNNGQWNIFDIFAYFAAFGAGC